MLFQSGVYSRIRSKVRIRAPKSLRVYKRPPFIASSQTHHNKYILKNSFLKIYLAKKATRTNSTCCAGGGFSTTPFAKEGGYTLIVLQAVGEYVAQNFYAILNRQGWQAPINGIGGAGTFRSARPANSSETSRGFPNRFRRCRTQICQGCQIPRRGVACGSHRAGANGPRSHKSLPEQCRAGG